MSDPLAPILFHRESEDASSDRPMLAIRPLSLYGPSTPWQQWSDNLRTTSFPSDLDGSHLYTRSLENTADSQQR